MTAALEGEPLTVSPEESAGAESFALTPRETMILCLVAGGLTNAQAARQLHISRHTVAQHIAEMLQRARASNRAELIARAYTSGLLATDAWPPRPPGPSAGKATRPGPAYRVRVGQPAVGGAQA